jgi:hypothetical protein
MLEDGKLRENRTSLLTTAKILANGVEVGSARIRNLSPRGMGGIASCVLNKDEEVSLVLKGPGEVAGVIAWVKGYRFGMRFVEEIDLRALKMPAPVLKNKPNRFTFDQRYQPVANYKRPGFHGN